MTLVAGAANTMPSMSFRLAAYAVCIDDAQVLLVHHVRTGSWTLPGGRVEHAEDPFDAVVREVAEETGYTAVVESLLGVDSRVIPASQTRNGGPEHQNVGIFYRVQIIDGKLRSEPDGDTGAPTWTSVSEVDSLRRSSLVDVGITLARTAPATGHVAPAPVGGLIRH